MKDLCDPLEKRTAKKRTLKEMVCYRTGDETRGFGLIGTERRMKL